jgi:hypothetical protein
MMKNGVRYLVLPLLALVLACASAWAQRGIAVTPLAVFSGSVADETKNITPSIPITDAATLHRLWTYWGITDAEPVVDFTQQLVVFATTRGSGLRWSLLLEQGNLTIGDASTTDMTPGFRYKLAVIDKADIAGINGTPLVTASGERPVLILQHITAGVSIFKQQQFLTVTDEHTWNDTIGRNEEPPFPVDFTQDEVILVAMGEHQTAGYSIDITRVMATDTRINVTVKKTIMDQMIYRSMTPSQPFAAVVIPKSSKPVYFLDSWGGVGLVPTLMTIKNATSLQKTADTVVIKDVAAWKKLYDTRMPPGTPLPEVNFGENMALVVFAGDAWSEVNIEIISVVGGDETLQVLYYISNPPIPAGAIFTTYPWTAVIVPKSELPVTFHQLMLEIPDVSPITGTTPTVLM